MRRLVDRQSLGSCYTIQRFTIMCPLRIALKMFLIRMMALSVFALPSVAADVTMSAELSSKTLSIRWTNSGDHSCLLNLGSASGKYPLYNLRLTVSANKEEGEASINSGPSAISGRVDPWVAFMPKASQFQSNVGLDDIRLNRSGIRLSQVHPPYRLTITYVAGPAYDYAPGGKKIPFSLTQNGPTTVPFCSGSVTINAEIHAQRPEHW